MTPDIAVNHINGVAGEVQGDVEIRTINIDLNQDDCAQDFGESILIGEVQCDHETWLKFKRRLEAMDNLVSALRMINEKDASPARRAAAERYVQSVLDYVDAVPRT